MKNTVLCISKSPFHRASIREEDHCPKPGSDQLLVQDHLFRHQRRDGNAGF